MNGYRPTIAITMGDPAGIGPEVIVKALSDAVLRHRARYIIYGMNELLSYAADLAEYDVFWWRDQFNGRLRAYPHDVVVVDYDQYSMLGGSAVKSPSKMGGEASMRSASTRSRPPTRSWSTPSSPRRSPRKAGSSPATTSPATPNSSPAAPTPDASR